MTEKKRVLVYPCGTEIGLEIYRACCKSIHFELIGGASDYDHGQFVYQNLITEIPRLTDKSTADEINKFNDLLKRNRIDIVYPAMDGVVTVLSKYRNLIDSIVVAPSYETTKITRSKKLTYDFLKNDVLTPKIFSSYDKLEYPVFLKPDVGQGSVGTHLIKDENELSFYTKDKSNLLVLENLPGEEYTIDCFTNSNGKLIFAKGRKRNRIKTGISVNAFYIDDLRFRDLAEKINKKLENRGGWFFQVKEDSAGNLKLLEVASRIAGTSAITRNLGVNLPLLTLFTYINQDIDSVVENSYKIELDRAFENKYKVDIQYNSVYVDYDDTLVMNGYVNTQLVKFIFQCINEKKEIFLLTKHEGTNLEEELNKYRLSGLFDKIIHLKRDDQKYLYITDKSSIFIDDSFGERLKVKETLGINVFDVHNIECLLKDSEK